MAWYRNRKHKLSVERGEGVSRAYGAWTEMRKRVRHPVGTNRCYAHVSISPRWDDFEAFLADMGVPPDGLSLDRIEPTGNYEPGNCRWADATMQARNRVVTRLSLEKAKAIREQYASGNVSQQEIANGLGVSQVLISQVVRKRIWV